VRKGEGAPRELKKYSNLQPKVSFGGLVSNLMDRKPLHPSPFIKKPPEVNKTGRFLFCY